MAPPIIRIIELKGTPEEMQKQVKEMMENMPKPQVPTIEAMVSDLDDFLTSAFISFVTAMGASGASTFDIYRALHLATTHQAGLLEELRKNNEKEEYGKQSIVNDTKQQFELGGKHFHFHENNEGHCPDDPFGLKNDAKVKA